MSRRTLMHHGHRKSTRGCRLGWRSPSGASGSTQETRESSLHRGHRVRPFCSRSRRRASVSASSSLPKRPDETASFRSCLFSGDIVAIAFLLYPLHHHLSLLRRMSIVFFGPIPYARRPPSKSASFSLWTPGESGFRSTWRLRPSLSRLPSTTAARASMKAAVNDRPARFNYWIGV